MTDPHETAKPGRAPADLDPNTPTIARIYDYMLGGKDNFAADREMAERLRQAIPHGEEVARANRRFLVRVVRHFAERGITQFLDFGTGIPTSPNVHEVARETQPGARVVYVDNDPIVAAHNRAQRETPGVVALHADMRDADGILDAEPVRELIDFSEPVALLFIASLHYLSRSEDAAGLIRHYASRVPRGSVFAASIATSHGLDPVVARELQATFDRSSTPIHLRPLTEIEDLVAPVDLAEPALVPITEWHTTEPAIDLPILAAVGTVR